MYRACQQWEMADKGERVPIADRSFRRSFDVLPVFPCIETYGEICMDIFLLRIESVSS